MLTSKEAPGCSDNVQSCAPLGACHALFRTSTRYVQWLTGTAERSCVYQVTNTQGPVYTLRQGQALDFGFMNVL